MDKRDKAMDEGCYAPRKNWTDFLLLSVTFRCIVERCRTPAGTKTSLL